MTKTISFIAIAFFLSLGQNTTAQVGTQRAERLYVDYAFMDAIDIYESIVKKGKTNSDILQNAGNSYYFNGQYEKANEYYTLLFTDYEHEIKNPEYYYRYAQTLLNIGKNSIAKKYFDKFTELSAVSPRSSIINSEIDYLLEIEKNSGRYQSFRNIEINTMYSDYGSSIYNEQLLFTTSRDTGNFHKKEHAWTGEAFSKLYTAEINEDGSISNPKRLSKKLDSKFNESTSIITKDGNTIYFTRNNYNGTRGYDAEKTTKLKIYKSIKDKNGNWSTPESLSINSDAYSTAHPTLSSDEKTMYFASDRPGGYGDSDIWRVDLYADGRLGTPQNLGSQINTDGRETFPFIAEDNVLYFATDGRQGLGGLDVYAAKWKQDGTYTLPQNLGAPINTEYDDFAYVINSRNQGFVSSNRPDGKGGDDIYAFTQTRALVLECIQNLKITVIDAKTRMDIRDAFITIRNNDYSIHTTYECGNTYHVKVEKEGYITQEVVVTLPNETGITERQIVLEKKKVEVKKGDDLFKVLKLEPIYFDYDKDNIRPDAALELSKIVEVMNDYPNMKIDVRSHTDSRGSDNYNLKLSERRAKSTAEWIISQKINPARLSFKGYGETQLMNECKNGVKCSDEKHEENRRSEFIIVEL